MRTLVIALALFCTGLAQAGWKEDVKKAAQQQAQAKMEMELGLPQTAPPGAREYFINLKNGDTVTSPLLIQFGLKGMGVAPAGTQAEGTGHHHLLIDSELPVLTAPLPATDKLKHFGGGQTETELVLAPGKHTLQLILGDWKHQPHNPAVMSEKISITVK